MEKRFRKGSGFLIAEAFVWMLLLGGAAQRHGMEAVYMLGGMPTMVLLISWAFGFYRLGVISRSLLCFDLLAAMLPCVVAASDKVSEAAFFHAWFLNTLYLFVRAVFVGGLAAGWWKGAEDVVISGGMKVRVLAGAVITGCLAVFLLLVAG